MRAFLAFSRYGMNDARIAEYFLIFFCDKKLPVTPVNAGQFLQSVLDKKSRCSQTCLRD